MDLRLQGGKDWRSRVIWFNDVYMPNPKEEYVISSHKPDG